MMINSRRAARASCTVTAYLAIIGFAGVAGADNDKRDEAAATKQFDTFRELPITGIEPEGWLRTMLQNQRTGLTGFLDECSGWPFDTDFWLAPFPEKHSFSHQCVSAMWIDGMLRCGYLLRDDDLIEKARKYLDYTLAHPAENGILGPNWNDWSVIGKYTQSAWRYNQYHFFHALMTEYDVTKDRRILGAMRKHYLAVPPRQHAVHQGTGNIEVICWLYGMTGDEEMLRLAQAAWECCNDTKYNRYRNFDLPLDVLLSDKKATMHGLSYFDGIRGPALIYRYTGEKQLLDAVIHGFRKVDRDHLLIDGCPAGNECLTGKNPRVGHETCIVTAYSWVAAYMLAITGDAHWADRIERIVFNAGMGSITKDFRGLQYYSSPNQVVSTSDSSHNHQAGRERMQFRPGHGTQCCTGSVNRFLPNYVSRSWMSDQSGGLVAALYGPGKVTAKVGKDEQEVTIVEKTDYPFSETIEFEIQANQKVHFPLHLRIPGWCQGASISLNGKPMNIETKAGTFVKLDREFSPNDRIVLSLPMDLKLSFWQEGGIGIERGPLVFSLLIKEDRKPDTQSVLKSFGYTTKPIKGYMPWNIRPASPWNYALHVSYNQKELEKEVEIIHLPMVENPWAIGASPIRLRVPAKRLPDWKLEDGIRTPRLPAPVLPADEVEQITLVPQGSTCIRLTIFPDCRYKWSRCACDRISAEDGT